MPYRPPRPVGYGGAANMGMGALGGMALGSLFGGGNHGPSYYPTHSGLGGGAPSAWQSQSGGFDVGDGFSSGGGGGLETGDALLEQGESDEPVKVKGGLALRGGRKVFLRAIEHNFREGITERGIGLLREVEGHWGGFDPIAGHAHLLGALSGE